MKKLLVVLVVLILSSCEGNVDNKTVNIQKDNHPYSAIKFTFEGHDYIQFTMYDFGYDQGCGYVHDPECRKCKENK